MRVYMPTTVARLRQALVAGEVGPAPLRACCVTDAVREALPDATEEDLEYAASSAAAQESVALLDATDPPIRLVMALDAADDAVRREPESDDATAVLLEQAAPLRRLSAVLADSADARGAVTHARDAVLAGSDDAAALLERCLDHELGWWASQELDVLLDGLETGPS